MSSPRTDFRRYEEPTRRRRRPSFGGLGALIEPSYPWRTASREISVRPAEATSLLITLLLSLRHDLIRGQLK